MNCILIYSQVVCPVQVTQTHFLNLLVFKNLIIHTCTYIYIHTYTLTCKFIYTYTHMRVSTHIRIYIHTHTHTCTYTLLYTYKQRYIQTYLVLLWFILLCFSDSTIYKLQVLWQFLNEQL